MKKSPISSSTSFEDIVLTTKAKLERINSKYSYSNQSIAIPDAKSTKIVAPSRFSSDVDIKSTSLVYNAEAMSSSNIATTRDDRDSVSTIILELMQRLNRLEGESKADKERISLLESKCESLQMQVSWHVLYLLTIMYNVYIS